MIEVIIAMDMNGGIGKEGKLPWHVPEELGLFKYKTMDSVLIVGRKTATTLPPLYNREIITVSSTSEIDSVEKAVIKARQTNKRKNNNCQKTAMKCV
jgi:dihydrofolate reductase